MYVHYFNFNKIFHAFNNNIHLIKKKNKNELLC